MSSALSPHSKAFHRQIKPTFILWNGMAKILFILSGRGKKVALHLEMDTDSTDSLKKEIKLHFSELI